MTVETTMATGPELSLLTAADCLDDAAEAVAAAKAALDRAHRAGWSADDPQGVATMLGELGGIVGLAAEIAGLLRQHAERSA